MSNYIKHSDIKFTQEQLIQYETIAISMMILLEIEQYLDHNHIQLEQFLKCIDVTKQYYERELLSGQSCLDLTMLAKFSQKYKVKFNFKVIDSHQEN